MVTIYDRNGIKWVRAMRNGKRYADSLKTRNISVARKRAKEWEEKLEAIAWGDHPRVQVGHAIRAFTEECAAILKPNSARRYAVSTGWISEYLNKARPNGGRRIAYMDEIDRGWLSEFEIWRRGMGVMSPTIRRDLICISAIYTYLEDRGWMPENMNPVPSYLKRRAKRGLKESPPRMRYLSHEEEERLLAACTPAVRNAVIVAIDTGLRQNEQFSLTWRQGDIETRTISTTNDTKSGRSRVVPMAERVLQIWRQLRKQASELESFPMFVFHHQNGTRFANMTKGLKAAARRANIPDLRWHDLRRTAGCRWIQDGGKRKEDVQVLLGHASVTTTERSYAFLDNEAIARDIASTKLPQRQRTKLETS